MCLCPFPVHVWVSWCLVDLPNSTRGGTVKITKWKALKAALFNILMLTAHFVFHSDNYLYTKILIIAALTLDYSSDIKKFSFSFVVFLSMNETMHFRSFVHLFFLFLFHRHLGNLMRWTANWPSSYASWPSRLFTSFSSSTRTFLVSFLFIMHCTV